MGFILLLFLLLVPNITFAEKASTSGQPKAKTNQPKEWIKIDDGLYQFNFITDTNDMTEADKSDRFFKELSQFKKDNSDERVIGFQSKVSEDPSHSIIGFTVATEKKEVNKAFITAIATAIATGVIGLLNLWYNLKNNKKTLFVDTITAERVKWMGQLREHVSEFLTLVTYHIEKNKDATQKDKSEYVDNVFRLAAKIKLHLNYLDRKDQKIIKIVDEFTNDIKKIFEAASLGDPLEDEVMNELLEPKQAEIDIEAKKRYEDFTEKHQRPLTMEEMARIDRFVFKDYQALVLNEIKRENEALIKRMDTNPQKLLSLTQAYLKDEWNRVKAEAESGNITKK